MSQLRALRSNGEGVIRTGGRCKLSAAAFPQLDLVRSGIFKNWVRVKPSFLKGVARRLDSYTAIVCFGVVVAMGIGLSRTWGKISLQYFVKVTGMSSRACELAIAYLLSEGLIRRRKVAVGKGWEYALAVRSSGDGESKLASCRNCKRTDDLEVDQDFIPVPHSFFRDLPAAYNRGLYLMVMAVIVRTVKMQDGEIVSLPDVMTIDDFRKATGLERSQILANLPKLKSEEILGSEKRGQNVFYWVNSQNFGRCKARPCRTVDRTKKTNHEDENNTAAGNHTGGTDEQPGEGATGSSQQETRTNREGTDREAKAGGEDRRMGNMDPAEGPHDNLRSRPPGSGQKTSGSEEQLSAIDIRQIKSEDFYQQKQDQPKDSKQTTRPVDFVTLPCAFCRHCETYGPVDLIPTEISVRKPMETARGAPGNKKRGFLEDIDRRRQEALDEGWKRYGG